MNLIKIHSSHNHLKSGKFPTGKKSMNMNKIKHSGFLLFLLLICASFFPSFTKAEVDGKASFSANCAQCHSVGKGVVIGPDLKDVHKRRQEDWLIKWIKSSKAVINSGDSYAVELFNKYNKTEMPNQNLSDEEIKAILAYTKVESEKAPAAKTVAAGDQASGEQAETNWPIILTSIAAILLGLAVILAKLKKTLVRVVREKQGLPEIQQLPAKRQFINWARGNKKLVAVILLALVLIGSVKGWYILADIGISQGYQPDQPIAFSHKIHAGENGISCVYCHSGAEKGKTAGIPSANVCMNCHKAIKEGTTTGTEEIAKIYKALDYNPETQTYGNNPKPLKWVRVHNLPDFAYFNHSQHVVVGKQQCQTCHGPVQEMTVAKQFSSLTMGWCIDCHRTTEVQMAGNHYYDDYHKKLQEKYGQNAKLTVESIGGTECARCHY
jgi:mono/diheme cytochrome c family protein